VNDNPREAQIVTTVNLPLTHRQAKVISAKVISAKVFSAKVSSPYISISSRDPSPRNRAERRPP